MRNIKYLQHNYKQFQSSVMNLIPYKRNVSYSSRALIKQIPS